MAAPLFVGGRVATDVVVTNPSDWTVSLSMTVDTEVHLTASAIKPVSASAMAIEIHSITALGNSEVAYCYNTSVCSVATTPSESQSTYIAVVTPSNSGKTMPTTILAVSETQTPPAWTLDLSSNITSVVSLTAASNYKLNSKTTRWLRIFDLATGKAVPGPLSWCNSGTVCTQTGFVPTQLASRYAAYVTTDIPSAPPSSGFLAISSTVTPPPWTITLEGSGNTLTARTNYDTSATGNQWMEFFDISSSSTAPYNYIKFCNAGTVCTATVTSTRMGHQFIATAGTTDYLFPPDPMLAVSNQVSLQGPTSPYETAGGSNPAELNDCYACAGDPINTSNGEFFEINHDITVPSRGPDLGVSRTYSSQRAAIDGRFGFGWADAYSMAATEVANGTVQILQENGSRVVFTPAGSGTYTAPSHVLAKLVKNPDGTWTYTRRSKEVFNFGTSGKLTSIEDLNSNALTLAWDTSGKLATVTDDGGRAITFTYGSNGKVATATDPAGGAVSYGYDAAGRLETVTLPGSRVTSYTYDASNLVTSITDPRGTVTVNTYDQARRVTKQTTAAGDLILAYGADGSDALTTLTSPGGRITKETYRGGQMIKRIVGVATGQQATWTYTYDAATFAKATVTDPLNRTSSATYDARGNKLTATDSGGRTTTATYDALDNLLTSTNPAGTTTTFTYDAAGNRLTASTPLTGTSQSALSSYTYGDTAHPSDITAVTDPNGHSTTFAYDSYGNRTSTTDALGRISSTAYDTLSRATSTTTPAGKTTTFAYTTAGFLASATDPLGKAVTYVYDVAGNTTSMTDRMGRTTGYSYDALGRKTATTAPDTTVTATGYDADGNTTSQTDQASHVTSYAYDSRNRLTSSTDALNRVTSYAYDAAGHLTGKTDASNRTTTFTYNAAGDQTGTSYSDGVTPNETFTYTVLHEPATIIDGTGTTTMSYDSLGRLTSRTNGAGKNVSYSYDLAGNVTSQTYPNSQAVTRTYDAANNLTGITDWLNNTTTYTTTADSRPDTTAYANGITSTSSYSDNGLITGIGITNAAGTVASFGYTRNDNGNLATASTTGISQPAETYGYTTRDELASINTSTYGYDSAGNPTTLANGATLTYDAANQATQFTLGGTTTAITHDAQGNRLTGPAPTIGTSTHSWNQANRLKSANGTTFTYDATGLRASRTPGSGPSQSYVWETSRDVPLMLTDGTLSYIYDAAGNPVEHIDTSGAVTYYQHDQYGSTRLLTDSAGSTTAIFTFDANGNLAAKTGTADTVLRWNGQAQDGDTGLYYLRNRYYDPTTVQFISVDPLMSVTRDAYRYASNDPLNLADPTGLISIGVCMTGAIGSILGAMGQVCGVAAIDDRDGTISLGTTRTLGGGMQTPTANLTIGSQLSTARSVDQLSGWFGYGGISAQEGLRGGGGIFGGKCTDAPGGFVLGAEYAGGIAAPGIPIEVHMGASYTWTETNFSFNPFQWMT